MKLWPTITENKYFVKMLWHLLGECVKATVLLVCLICIVHRFFFFFCVQNYVFLLKIACKKKYTKSQLKKIVCRIVNFGSTKLIKPIKNF